MSMSNKLRLALFCRLGFVLLACVVGCQPVMRMDVTGRWRGTFTYTSGHVMGITGSFRMDLQSSDGTITGTASFPSAGMKEYQLPITRAEIHADTVVLEASGTNDLVPPPAVVEFSFDGRVTPTTMSGVGTHTVNGTSYTFTWRTTLTAPPPAEP